MTITPQHRLRIEMPQDLPPVQMDSRLIAQVLTNLVGNAANYSPEHTEILLTAEFAGDRIKVCVCDKGIGIPPRERRDVFEAFRRGDNDRARKSRGAGLAISKGLVEAHAGSIWIEDSAGPGTTVCFTLPITPP
jgi:signal transduction histidine kinase